MITGMKFENWRSLKNAELQNLGSITVLIGENSSGKSNIIDALYFIREIFDESLIQAVYNRGGGENVRTVGVPSTEPVSIEFACDLPEASKVTFRTQMLFMEKNFNFKARRSLSQADKVLLKEDYVQYPLDEEPILQQSVYQSLRTYTSSRWQLLDENFMPALIQSSSSSGDLYVIDRCGDNLIFMLDFMKKTKPELYNELQDDLRYLLRQVHRFEAERGEHEARIYVREAQFPDKEAPTISFGTARILTMLVAVYALDLKTPDEPGLVVIEEPDTSLNPGLLKRFVELLRGYAEDKSRQFILTTHNPAFLNYFQPEEVRVVERGDEGHTTISTIPDYVSDIWLNDNPLGEVWLTNTFGGVVS
ncbi:MAG: AAA family ATPase [Chloroflexi bacterium]|nr:AAA family ATPase [Chloroflexota bacterium]